MSPTRRSSSPTSRSYLHQLAAPLPSPSRILVPRRPNVERGPHNVLDSIPPILESVRVSTNDFPDGSPNARSDSDLRASSASQAPEVQSEHKNRVAHLRRDPIADHVAHHTDPSPFTADHHFKRPQPDPSPVQIFSSHPLQAPAGRSEEVSSASGPTDTLTSIPLSQSPTRKYTTRAASNAATSARTQPIEIHIGAVEVRSSAPPPPSDLRPVARDLNSMHTAAPPARPLSRGLTWTYGLVQG